jgi:hypothetical protein
LATIGQLFEKQRNTVSVAGDLLCCLLSCPLDGEPVAALREDRDPGDATCGRPVGGAASAVGNGFSFGRGGVSRISGQGEFADYRAIGTGAAIAPILGVVISAKNETRNFDQFFSTFIKRVDYSGILSPESLIAMSGTPAAVGRLGCGGRRRNPYIRRTSQGSGARFAALRNLALGSTGRAGHEERRA